MQLAIIENNGIKIIGDAVQLFPNVSFPSTEPEQEFLENNSVMVVQHWENFDNSSEVLEPSEPYIKGNKVYTYVKRAKTLAELEQEETNILIAKEKEIRVRRNQLLKDSDWTQVADAPVDKAAWATYRQELRDVTSQEGFPFNVVFPNPPL
jgi:hypothetical protein